MNIQHLDWRVTSLLNETSALKEEIVRFFQNTENNFAQRWEAFLQFARLGGKEHSWVYHGWDNLSLFPKENWKGEVVNDLNWYEDFNVERYQTYDLVETGLDRILDHFWYDSLGEDTKMFRAWNSYNDAEPNPLHALEWALFVYREPLVIQAVEALMRDGVTRFTYDW